MTIDQLKMHGKGSYFVLKSPSGIEFIACPEEMFSPRSSCINWNACSVSSEAMDSNQASEWRMAHPITTEIVNRLESELVSANPNPRNLDAAPSKNL